jgi:Ca2+-transporting ATPase
VPDDSSVAGPVIRSPGRIRIECPRLYRSHAEKIAIETRLAACRNITAVYANPLTARVLVLFDGQTPPAEIFAALGSPASPDTLVGPDKGTRATRARSSIRRGISAPKPEPDKPLYPPWYLRDANAALEFHRSSSQCGLASSDAAGRLTQGLNLLPQPPVRSQLEILLGQFKSLPILLLGVSATLSLLTGGLSEAVAIAAVLVLNGGIGFITERRAESAIASLSELIDDIVPVLRDGKISQVQSSHIATGDMLALAPGVHVAADARLIQANSLTVDESALTGESLPAAKNSAALSHSVALADRTNMVYRGTAVSTGSGMALVVGTGGNTEIGAIQSLMAQTEHPKTPIQKQLDQLGNQLVMASGGICAGVFAIGLLRGYGLLHMLKVSISLAIAAVPEGLPAVATTSLARGIRAMREKNALIRRLQAVETIGAIQIICFDKTGTLTMNRMSAVEVQADGRRFEIDVRAALPVFSNPESLRLLEICVLCNEAVFNNGDPDSMNGSSTERALLDLATEAGLPVAELRSRYPLLITQLRAERRKYMKTVHAIPGSQRHMVAVKGSPLEVLALCRHYQSNGKRIALTDQAKADILRQNEHMAERGLRVLGFAYAETDPAEAGPVEPPGLIWVGLVGLADPLRPGAKDLIASFHRAGIRTTMLTGDQGTTALAIGKAVGINSSGDQPSILDAEQMEWMKPEQLASVATTVDIFGRVSPSEKLHIVQALRASGKTIAMIGDGINDGPALQAADIGIAMGAGGTDLARSAADVVLRDDQLATMLQAISQGRTTFTNIEKSLHFLLSSNFSEIIVVLAGVLFATGSPLTPMQLLWLNLLTDVLPGIALAAEPPETDVMRQPPRDPVKPLIGKKELRRYSREAGVLAGGALAAYWYGSARHGAGQSSRSGAIAFNSLILGQLMHAISCRSDRHGIFAAGQRSRNRQLDAAVAACVGLQLLANIVPGLRRLLNTGSMNAADIIPTMGGAVIPLLINEAAKKTTETRQ